MKGCVLDEYNKHADIPREQYFLFVKTIYEWLKENDLLDEDGYKILDKIGQEGILSNGKKVIIGETFTTQGMTQKGFNYIYMIYVDNMYNRDNKEILNINDTPQEIKDKLDENYPRFCELYDGQGHRIKGVGFRYRGFSQLTDNISKGIGKGNFGYGLRKKDGSGLDFTESTKKKLAKEREAFLKGDNKYGQFSNNIGYDTIIIFRYDGKSLWDNNCMSVQLVYENNQWVINDTSVTQSFNKKSVEGMLVHCKNKQKQGAKVLVLANENKALRKVLNEFGYNPKSLYSILPTSLKSSYPLNKVGEQGYPHANSQKNMSIDISFFYKAFGNQSSVQAFSNLFTEPSRAIMFRQQIGQALTRNPKKFPPELHQKLVGLDKKYMKSEDPIAYLNGLDQREIHRAYLEYKMFWMQIQQWDNTHDGKGNRNFAVDMDDIKGILMDPEDESQYENIMEALEGTKAGNKLNTFWDWALQNRKKVALIGAALLGIISALQAYSYMIYGHGILFIAFKKFNKWLSAKGTVDNAIKGSPFEGEWMSIKKEIENANTPEQNKAAVEKLSRFAKKIQNFTHKGFSMTYDDLLEKTFSIKSMLVNPKVVGAVIGSLASALILTKLARMNARRIDNTKELYAKVNETADKVNLIVCDPKNQHFMGKYRTEWDALYKEIKSTPDTDTRFVKQCDDKLNSFGNKAIEGLKTEIEGIKSGIEETKQYQQFSPRLQSIFNFSIITKRDDVLNSLRLVFKEMPKDAPQLNQVFLALQSKYFKERMGVYDIEALKPKVQEMSETQLEECNTALRGLLKEIRNFNKNPIINKGPRGNRLPRDNDLNKIERLGRDIGKNARNILMPVSLGLGATLTARRLLKGN